VCRLEADVPIPLWVSEPLQRTAASHRVAASDINASRNPGAAARVDAAARSLRSSEIARFISITRTDHELSIVCDETLVPEGVRAERGFVALRVVGTLDFSLTGIIARLTVPLAGAGVPVFVVSTFESDYILVRVEHRAAAIAALCGVGHILIA